MSGDVAATCRFAAGVDVPIPNDPIEALYVKDAELASAEDVAPP
jgi:hypothetical protein